jgi:pyridoxal biosynthesis lyase PdxS
MNITKAKYVMSKKYDESSKSWVNDKNKSVLATIDGQEWSVPLVEGNRHYDEIMRQVAEGTITIEAAD